MNEIKKKKAIQSHKFYGIVLAKDWFKSWFEADIMPVILPDSDYIVCEWYDYHDGFKSNIEGASTIAICRNLEDAELIYNIKK